MDKKNISDRFLYIPVIILVINFLYRLIDQSKIIKIFPLDYVNDISSYLAQLFFLRECGFLKICTYWYNGFITFTGYSPGWYFFSFPIYILTNNILITAYISLILMLLIGFIIIYIIGKQEKLSKTRIFSFFIFFFANAIAIGNFIRLGRLTSLFGWISSLGLIAIMLYYKEKKLTKYFPLIFIPTYFILILSHSQEFILFNFILLGLFIIKSRKEKLMIILYAIISIVSSSFWLIPYIRNSSSIRSIQAGMWNSLKDQPLNLIISFLIPIIFLLILYFYLKSNQNKKRELLFYSPLILIAILLISKLVAFIPLLKDISLDHYLFLFIFFSILLFFKTNLENYGKFKKLLPFLIIIASIASVSFNLIYTPKFISHGPLEEEVLSLSPYINGRMIIISDIQTSYTRAYYSYLPIYYNVSTALGWSDTYMSKEYEKRYKTFYGSLKNLNINTCNDFLKNLKQIDTTNLIAINDDCKKLEDCKLELLKNTTHTCLYKSG